MGGFLIICWKPVACTYINLGLLVSVKPGQVYPYWFYNELISLKVESWLVIVSTWVWNSHLYSCMHLDWVVILDFILQSVFKWIKFLWRLWYWVQEESLADRNFNYLPT